MHHYLVISLTKSKLSTESGFKQSTHSLFFVVYLLQNV